MGDSSQLRLYGIPNCDTVKRALAWLREQPVTVEFHDLKRQPVSPGELQTWLGTLGADALINRRGTTWRQLTPALQAQAGSEAGALALMQAQPSVIKRPVVRWPDGALSVGFDADAWAQRLGPSGQAG